MRVDRQRAIPGTPTHEIVPSVPDKEPNVVIASKIDASLDVVARFCHDNITREVAD